MSSLTVRVEGVLDEALKTMVSKGYAKTKAEAVRMALMEFAKEHQLVETGKRLHERAEDYMWDEIKERLKLDVP